MIKEDMTRKKFNVSGPCDPLIHYTIDPLRGLENELFTLIRDRQYFIIHAARQSGKTTLLKQLTRIINQSGLYYGLYCSMENMEGLSDAAVGIPSIIDKIQTALLGFNMPDASSYKKNIDIDSYPIVLERSLSLYCRSLDKPLVVFFDEADCLCGQTLISFLRQLRSGYSSRPDIPFVHSLALVGMRNIRDYRDEYRPPERTLGRGSPFNIVKETMTLSNFTFDQIVDLYGQHTAETGQVFDTGAIELAWRQTQGQPWLVNAIACEIVEKTTANDRQAVITERMVADAIQTLIVRREAHFDSLIAHLREARVRRVIEPVMIGAKAVLERASDDYSYVKDLGLIRDDLGKTEPANPIYGEVIVRSLNWDTQKELEESGGEYQMPRYLSDGVIDMDCLLTDFQAFWRENADIWREKYDYKEAAPQLILQAFLQRVLNGGGQIVREMAAATGRADLCVIYRGVKYPIEMKIRYGDNTYDEGIEQLSAYMDVLGCSKSWLVVFDHRKNIPWEKKLFARRVTRDGREVGVYGC